LTSSRRRRTVTTSPKTSRKREVILDTVAAAPGPVRSVHHSSFKPRRFVDVDVVVGRLLLFLGNPA